MYFCYFSLCIYIYFSQIFSFLHFYFTLLYAFLLHYANKGAVIQNPSQYSRAGLSDRNLGGKKSFVN